MNSKRELIRLVGRVTSPRRQVLEALPRLGDTFSAEEMCQAIPAIGRATVYRTLKLLVETGVVCKVALADGAPRYRLSQAGHHHHLVCMRCGSVQDFDRCAVDDLIQHLERHTDFAVLGHRIEVYGLCGNCQTGGIPLTSQR